MNQVHHMHEVKEIFGYYEEACIWLKELGLNVATTRYGRYRIHFERFHKAGTTGLMRKASSMEEFNNAYLEAHELVRLHRMLSSIDSTEFLKQLEKVMSGQEFRGKVDHDQGRDFLFELSVASRFLYAGLNVSLTGICDVVVDMRDRGHLYVECKRVKSPRKLGANVKKANSQIAQRVSSSENQRVRGLIAVEITDLLPRRSLMRASVGHSQTQLKQTMREVLERDSQQWQLSFDPSCLGLMFQSSTVNYLTGQVEGLINSRHSTFVPTVLDSESEAYLKVISASISNQDIVKVDSDSRART